MVYTWKISNRFYLGTQYHNQIKKPTFYYAT